MKSILRFLLLALLLAMPSLIRADDLPTRDELETTQGSLVISPISHATMVLEWHGKTLYVDPVGGGELFADFPKPDLILITDIHGDHCDPDTVRAVRKGSTQIISPAAVAERFEGDDRAGLETLANGETLDWQGIEIEAIAMYNLTAERQDFHTKGRGNGYVLELGGRRIYISGDTEDIPEMRALEQIDAAFVCMNLPYTMDLEHAADAVLAFRPKVVYPYHYRGKGMVSDVEKFAALVGKGEGIEVRRLKWY